MDKLKRYLEVHKEEMDVDLPPASVWQNVQAQHNQQAITKRFPNFMRYAAAVIFMIVAATIWFMTKNEKEQPVVSVPRAEKSSLVKPALIAEGKFRKVDSVHGSQAAPARSTTKATPANTNTKKSETITEAVTDIYKGYAGLVAHQMDRLRTTPVYAETTDYFTTFSTQLAEMDRNELEIKRDMKEYGMNDQLLESLTNVYERKLNLLKNLQKEVNRMNKAVKQTADTSSVRPFFLNL